jgi:hypothetical protein
VRLKDLPALEDKNPAAKQELRELREAAWLGLMELTSVSAQESSELKDAVWQENAANAVLEAVSSRLERQDIKEQQLLLAFKHLGALKGGEERLIRFLREKSSFAVSLAKVVRTNPGQWKKELKSYLKTQSLAAGLLRSLPEDDSHRMALVELATLLNGEKKAEGLGGAELVQKFKLFIKRLMPSKSTLPPERRFKRQEPRR